MQSSGLIPVGDGGAHRLLDLVRCAAAEKPLQVVPRLENVKAATVLRGQGLGALELVLKERRVGTHAVVVRILERALRLYRGTLPESRLREVSIDLKVAGVRLVGLIQLDTPARSHITNPLLRLDLLQVFLDSSASHATVLQLLQEPLLVFIRSGAQTSLPVVCCDLWHLQSSPLVHRCAAVEAGRAAERRQDARPLLVIVGGRRTPVLPDDPRCVRAILGRVSVRGEVGRCVVHGLCLSVGEGVGCVERIGNILILRLRRRIDREYVLSVPLIEVAEGIGNLGSQDLRLLAGACVTCQADWVPELAL